VSPACLATRPICRPSKIISIYMVPQGRSLSSPMNCVLKKIGQPVTTIDLPAEHASTTMWQAILTAYQAGQEPAYTAMRALQDVAILEAVAQSIAQGQRVTIAQVI